MPRHFGHRLGARFGRRGLTVLTLCTILFYGFQDAAAAPTPGKFNSAGTAIHYIEEGTGEPVVLIHGFTNTAQNWIRTGVFTALAREYRVIAIDCRGHGQSDKPRDPKQYGRQMGMDVVRLLDHLKIRRAHIVGYSMGGGIVAQLLIEHPERFISATLGGNAGRRSWTAQDEAEMRLESAEMETGVLRSQYRRLAPTNGPPPTDDEIRQRSAERLQGQDRLAFAAVLRSRPEFVQTAAQMAAVRVPTLGIVGSLDPAVAAYKQLQAMVRHLELVVIEGAAHGAAPSRPEFIQSLTAFLRRAGNGAR
jgi:pimeloyl-ACP methyl ester carboxylesterase